MLVLHQKLRYTVHTFQKSHQPTEFSSEDSGIITNYIFLWKVIVLLLGLSNRSCHLCFKGICELLVPLFLQFSGRLREKRKVMQRRSTGWESNLSWLCWGLTGSIYWATAQPLHHTNPPLSHASYYCSLMTYCGSLESQSLGNCFVTFSRLTDFYYFFPSGIPFKCLALWICVFLFILLVIRSGCGWSNLTKKCG